MAPLTLAQLEKLNPETIGIDSPETEPFYKARLVWLIDHHPRWARELYKKNLLHRELLRNLQRASLEQAKLTLKGMSPLEAEELVLEQIVAPAEAPPASEPLPEAEAEEILHALLH